MVAPTKAPRTFPPPTPTLSPAGTVDPSGPGQPYGAADLQPYFANAPEGFPNVLKTQQVAEALAGRIWSFDGQPYRMAWLDGSCESGRCEVSFTGLPVFAPTPDTEDVFFVTLDQRSGIFSETHEPSLKGFPPNLVDRLDTLARSLDTKGTFSGLPLLGSEWVIPPPDDAFTLRYGRGNEEGDPTYLVTLSRADRRILTIRKF